MKKKWLIPCFIAVFAVLLLFYTYILKAHTFTLSAREDTLVRPEIQPLFGTVKVSGDCDTDVVFTDLETGEIYSIEYITSGVSEKIRLQRGRWYCFCSTRCNRHNIFSVTVDELFIPS